MFIEHIDQLRCTTGHEESWLIASITKRDNRFVLEGTLGCHICHRQYPIINGVAYFGTTPADQPKRAAQGANPDDVMRIAAFLNAGERARLVLCGVWGSLAQPLSEMIPVMVSVLAPEGIVEESAQIAHVESSEGIPLARASVDGVALDQPTATPQNILSALRVLKSGGRLVAPISVTLPEGVVELARDDTFWVAEKLPGVVPLRRA